MILSNFNSVHINKVEVVLPNCIKTSKKKGQLLNIKFIVWVNGLTQDSKETKVEKKNSPKADIWCVYILWPDNYIILLL